MSRQTVAGGGKVLRACSELTVRSRNRYGFGVTWFGSSRCSAPCAAAMLVAAIAGAGCGGCDDDPPAVVVTATRDLGPLEQLAAIRGRDGGYSGRFADRSVWLYGDTILAFAGEDGTSWRNNTGSVTADFDATDGVTGFVQEVDGLGAPREFFPRTADEAEFNDAHSEVLHGDQCEAPCGARFALWPGPLVADPARDRALIFYTEIYGEPGEWNFHSVGMGIATWAGLDQPVDRPVIDPGAAHPTLLFGEGEPMYASAAAVKDDTLYAFGCDSDGFGKPCRLARVALAEVLNRDAWRYYAGGDRWSEEPGDAIGLFDGMDMTTVHYSPRFERWLAFYSPPFANRVALRSAPALTGPWSDEATAFDTLAPVDDPDHYAYSGLGHPELQSADGSREYVSYYRGTGAWQGEIRLVELALAARE